METHQDLGTDIFLEAAVQKLKFFNSPKVKAAPIAPTVLARQCSWRIPY
jgi:hypothetical protein